MNPDAEINSVTLTVARVGEGGNANRGMYFFDFSPHPIVLDKHSSWIVFDVSSGTPAEMAIRQLITSDALGQFGSAIIEAGGRRAAVQVKNTVAYLVQVALLLYNEKTGETVVCDPQVICRPPPPTPVVDDGDSDGA